MKRMGLMFMALLVAVTFLAVGCASPPPPEETPTAPPPEPAKVVCDDCAGDLRKAGVAVECGHYDIAMQLLEGVLNADVSDRMKAVAYNYRGLAYFWTGNYSAAIDDFTSAIEMFPAYDAAYYNRGFAHMKNGDAAAAAADMAKAQRMGYFPQNKGRAWCPAF